MRKRGRPKSSDAARRRVRVARLAAEIVRGRSDDVARIAKALDVDERTVRGDLAALEATPDPVAPASVAQELSKQLANAKAPEEISRVERSIGVELAAGRLPLEHARVLLEVCRRMQRKPRASRKEVAELTDAEVLAQAFKNCPVDLRDWKPRSSSKKADHESEDELDDDDHDKGRS